MSFNYRDLRGPAHDEDCDCHCSADRQRFQHSLDEIAAIVNGKTARDLTDGDIQSIEEQADHR